MLEEGEEEMILHHWRETQNMTETARKFHLSRHQAKQAVIRAAKAEGAKR